MASAVTSTPKAKANEPTTTEGNSFVSFVTKPARGWLHPDHLFAQDGINYNVKYMGNLEINTSMKTLDFEARTAVAKECIHRLCGIPGARSADTNTRKSDPRINHMIGTSPSLDHAATNVQLTITSLWLKLSDLDSGKAVYVFEMPNISFASGGDPYLQDYVAFVAKSKSINRACYVMECKGGIAQDVIMTIGQAFELRFKEYLRKRPVARPPPISMVPDTRRPDEVEYYNDLPGKTPPEFSPVQKSRLHKESGGSNLIDFNSELSHSRAPSHFQEPEYVNGDIPNPRKSNRDPFDMSPFATNAPGGGIPDVIKAQLEQEDWYHGAVSRDAAERLLKNNGDFLVRDSGNTPGQYVLSGMQNNSKKHLLLVDPNGIVRTKDRTFDSVSHLINYHRESGLPIISAESALRLITPIKRNF